MELRHRHRESAGNSYSSCLTATAPVLDSTCATKGVDDQRMKVPPGQWLVQPGSYPCVWREQSVRTKPRRQQSALGGPAKTRAVTRVNPEQSSKVKMRESTLQSVGEDRRVEGKQPMYAPSTARRGTGDGTFRRPSAQRGRPGRVRGRASQRQFWWRPGRESEGVIVPLSPGKLGGGKEPYFWSLRKEPRRRRLA